MINPEVVARPYAKALFEFAESKSPELWLQTLEILVRIVEQSDFQAALGEPQLPQRALAEVLMKSLTDVVPEGLGNFLNILAHADRLAMLPLIFKQYKIYLEAALRIIDVEVLSAYPVSEEYQTNLSEILAERFRATIVLHVEVDPKLIAGAIIRVGDWVLDGTARGRLVRLANHLIVKEVK